MQTATTTDNRITVAVLAVALGTFSLMQSMVAPLIPTLQRDLHTTQNMVTWVLTAYLLSAAVATPILGRLADRYGKERMLVVSLAALAIGALLAALATSIGVMIVARAIQGIGGGVMPISYGIVRDELPPLRVGRTIGFLSALLAGGGGVGVVIAGPLDGALGYQWLFAGAAVVVTVAIVITVLFVPESPLRTHSRIDIVPALLLSAALVTLLLGVSEASTWGWTSVRVIGLVTSGVVLAITWVLAELRSDHPLIDMRMMRLLAVWTTNAVSFLIGAALYTVVAFLPQFLQTPTRTGYGFGASVTESGLILLPQAAVMFVAGSSSGPVIARFGGRALMIVACLLTGTGYAWLAVAHGTIASFVLSSCFMGAGLGLAFAGMATIVIEAVPRHQTGAASGMNANIRTMGGAVITSVISVVITAQIPGGSGLPREIGYTVAFLIVAGLMVLGVGFALLMPRHDRGPTQQRSRNSATCSRASPSWRAQLPCCRAGRLLDLAVPTVRSGSRCSRTARPTGRARPPSRPGADAS